jgi:transcription termination/antitermination protein NusG
MIYSSASFTKHTGDWARSSDDPAVEGSSGAGPATPALEAESDAALLPWHAVWTRYRHEPLVCKELAAKGIETFLPTFTQVKKWSDRIKRIERPLFPGYCFARFEEALLSRVIAGAGVVAVLSNSGRPATIPREEIEALQRLVASGLQYDPCSALVAGSRVRVVTGPLAGIVGRLERKGGQDALILAVELINSATRVQVSAWDVEPL